MFVVVEKNENDVKEGMAWHSNHGYHIARLASHKGRARCAARSAVAPSLNGTIMAFFPNPRLRETTRHDTTHS